ncbi:metallophosphoesterase [Thermostilla marina]
MIWIWCFVILWLAAGHFCLWAAVWNRLHAMRIDFRVCQYLSAGVLATTLVVPIIVVRSVPAAGVVEPRDLLRLAVVPRAYIVLCAAAFPLAVWLRIWHRLRRRVPSLLHRSHEIHDLRKHHLADNDHDTPHVDVTIDRETEPVPFRPSAVLHVPGNESLRLSVVRLALAFDDLPEALDGLTICHLTDWHFTGRVARGFFDAVVDRSNCLNPDLVVLTGDLVDNPDCIETAANVFSRFHARLGVFFILGNHDVRVGVQRLRSALTERGLVDLGGKVHVLIHHDAEVLLAGNEHPWIPSTIDSVPLEKHAPRGFRIGLAHTPDRIDWARKHEIRLLLTGHTHGGQIRLPGFGPLLAPCCSGIRHAEGLFEYPPTVMYVNRGVSAQFPIRYFCPPELTHITLRRR